MIFTEQSALLYGLLLCFFLCISTQQINFDLELEPVKLLGNVEVVRSLADKKKGPKFYVHAKRNPLEAEVNNYDIIIILLRYPSVEAQWPHCWCTQLQIKQSKFEPRLRSLCCVLGKDTFLAQCLSTPRCINGYRRI